ncbi:MAG TPA: sugar-transfer associated ATP-grasp domain-containing protein [Candidatus Dojkabacteria bacterium]|nr:sugar-transfer associated ATP-grasp domain-containing protein [Candidatus Dojkabacteria bacterium]HRP51542.1 sugar-transfer associated ATP-grasp domain-containing protein [Candidatus Dojkabacteria bacterium]
MSYLDYWKNRKQVLGINERNLSYISEYNTTKSKKIADDKVLTKTVLNKAEIPTPKLITIIHNQKELRELDFSTLPNSFVLKPVTGLEGGGIEIFYNRDKQNNWIRADKSKVSPDEFYHHCIDILNGRYSIHQEPDSILIEERVKIHHEFKYYSYKGTPDIRVIVFNNIPIMSYIRLATKESAGKANLAMGAIGVGIDLAKGRTTSAIHGKSGYIEYVPGTKLRLSGLRIPYWSKMLQYAVEAQKATNLRFAAVDFLLDRDLGPLIVELNARPGLSIQLANDDGLRWRLKKATGLKVKDVEKGVRLGKDMFGGEIEEGIESIAGKDLIGIYETVTFYGKDDKTTATIAKVDTGADSTSIDKEIARKLGYTEVLDIIDSGIIPENVDYEEGLKIVRKLNKELTKKHDDVYEVNLVKSSHGMSIRVNIILKIKIQDTTYETKVSIFDRSGLTYNAIIGRKSLTKFLIDPSKIR